MQAGETLPFRIYVLMQLKVTYVWVKGREYQESIWNQKVDR